MPGTCALVGEKITPKPNSYGCGLHANSPWKANKHFRPPPFQLIVNYLTRALYLSDGLRFHALASFSYLFRTFNWNEKWDDSENILQTLGRMSRFAGWILLKFLICKVQESHERKLLKCFAKTLENQKGKHHSPVSCQYLKTFTSSHTSIQWNNNQWVELRRPFVSLLKFKINGRTWAGLDFNHCATISSSSNFTKELKKYCHLNVWLSPNWSIAIMIESFYDKSATKLYSKLLQLLENLPKFHLNFLL